MGANSSATNEIGPAGQTSDGQIGRVESGQPAGGPDDLGQQAHDRADNSGEVVSALGAGIDAFETGAARKDCPYKLGSEEGEQWLQGWDRQEAISRSQ